MKPDSEHQFDNGANDGNPNDQDDDENFNPNVPVVGSELTQQELVRTLVVA